MALAMTACQNNDEENFANKAYIDASSMVNETIVKGAVTEQEKTVCVTLARPAEADINATIEVNTSLLDTYVRLTMPTLPSHSCCPPKTMRWKTQRC